MILKINNNPFLNVLISIIILSSCETFRDGDVYSSLCGAYTCEETSAYEGYKKYIVEIDKVSSQDQLFIISNFHNQGLSEFIYASMIGDSLFIEDQLINGLFINGKGSVNADYNEIKLNYKTDDGNLEINYFARYTR